MKHDDVWRAIDTLAAENGLSASGLAKRSGLPLLRLQAYEAGLRRVIPPDLTRLCAALGVGPAAFLAGLPGAEGEDKGETEDERGTARTGYLA